MVFGTCNFKLGEEHDRTKESSECLKHLTQQAVKFQKTMNELYRGEKGITIPPIQVRQGEPPPSGRWGETHGWLI